MTIPFRIRWASGPATLLTLALIAVGCAGGSDDDTDANQGAGGEPAVPTGNGGDGADDPNNACVEDLSSLCANRECPSSPDEVTPFCGHDGWRTTYSAATACGGTVVVLNFGLGGSEWYFDEAGKLVGTRSSSDVERTCKDGHMSLWSVHGVICDQVGERTDLCDDSPSGGGGGAGGASNPGGTEQLLDACEPYPLSDLCSAHPKSCPASPDDIPLRDYCRIGDLKRYASSCGGTVVETNHDALGFESWSFDADDHLTGLVSTGDVPNDCKAGGRSLTLVYGEPCEPQGAGESICLGAGGAGGAAP